jgi:hypothetical protein
MRTQFVKMTEAGVKAYYVALKAQRKEAAEFYRDHPECTLGQVQEKFKLSPPTMRKALKENNVQVDMSRVYGRKQQRWTCPDCRRQVVHFCEDTEQGSKDAALPNIPRDGRERQERPHPGWISASGRHIPWSAEAELYLKDAFTPAASKEETSNEDYPEDSPEVKELLQLGVAGLFEKAKGLLDLD